MSMKREQAEAYWKANIRLILTYMAVWFVASYGCGILLVDVLNQIPLFGFKLGFWFAQQGSIFVFLVLIILYARSMSRLDEQFDVHEN